MANNFIKRVSGRQAGQLLHTQALPSDERTVMEKAQDDAIIKARLIINSALDVPTGFTFINEMDATESRQERQATINKWQALVDLNKATKKLESGYSPMRAHRRSKAARAKDRTMTFNKMAREYLESKGVLAKSDRDAIIAHFETMPVFQDGTRFCLNERIDGYPSMVKAGVLMNLDTAVVEWIDENKPLASYRTMFDGTDLTP